MCECTFTGRGFATLLLAAGVLFEVGVLERACLDRVGVLTPIQHR